VKVCRLHRSSVVRAAAKPASDLRDRARQVGQREQRILRRRQHSSVHHSPNQNVVARRGDAQAKSQMQGKVRQDRFRRRIAREEMSVSGSARRSPWARVKAANAAEVRRRDFVNRELRQVVEDLPMKRAADNRECRALKVSRRNNEVARSPHRNAAKHRCSRKAATENRKKERHRRSHNSFDAIVVATPDWRNPGSLVL
jgi:hypothetical protein